jgi:2,3-bisphosphoglycerate-independent phosphoglycerate mutase
VEAPDEASHSGDARAKIDAISRFDDQVVGTVLKGLESRQDYRILALPDHATPLEIKTHSDEPVPFLCYDASVHGNDKQQSFNEPAARASGLIFEEGWKLMDWFIKKAGT